MTPLVEIKFGSHLYGTSTPASDVDYKAGRGFGIAIARRARSCVD